MLFSFYYTEKVALIVRDKNPIMKNINKISLEKEVKYVNAIIDDDNIIAGKNGIKVDKDKSFYTMKAFNKFNEYYLSYKEVKPKISIYNNKDKYIIGGNKLDNNISIIIDEDPSIVNYFKSKKIVINKLVKKDTIDKYFESINNDNKYYNYVDNILDRYKMNKDLCFTNNEYVLDICKDKTKYLIKTELILNNSSYIDVKNKIGNGSIVFIEDNTSNEILDLFLKEIKFRGLNIVKISDLISEKNSN